jgi:putative phosphoesterase
MEETERISMRIAALYDIHGNLPSLEAVLREVRETGVDLIISGGDVVPGPMPREVLASLLNFEMPVQFLHGNGDREVLAVRAGAKTGGFPHSVFAEMRWCADQIDDESARVMNLWPPTLRLHTPAGVTLFCHATPRNDTEIFTRATAEERLLPIFASAQADIVVCGHTHMQFERRVGETRVVNAGSVGMPFQGPPGAYWLLLDRDVELRYTPYDLEAAAKRIRATGYPQAEQFAEKSVLHPPSEQGMIDAYSRYELG